MALTNEDKQWIVAQLEKLATNEKLEKAEERTLEAMRDMQTELLRGFEAFSGSQTLRIRKLEADNSNLDTSISGRMDIIERRLHQIEMRLGGAE
jgi:hypothetical protein